MYQVKREGVLSKGTSYALPAGSKDPSAIAFSPDGSYLASANQGGSGDITVFRVGARKELLSSGTSYPSHLSQAYETALAFSPMENTLLSSMALSGYLR